MSWDFINATGTLASAICCVTAARRLSPYDETRIPRHDPNINGAIRHLQRLRRESKGVTFTEEELELLAADFTRAREYMATPECATLLTRLAFIEVQIFGTASVDWDAELRAL